MEAKEAIEQIENYIKALEILKEPESKLYTALKKIVPLLQQGEKYRQMWEELEHGVVYDDEGDYIYSWSGKLIGHMHRIKREFEQKYFPKEERDDE